ncbi:MAG: putative glycolipid-binding domain-containing protein [Actinomycetota bacterium]
MRTLVWRRLDEPGMEAAHVESLSDASGVQVGSTYELRWRLRGDTIDLELNGDRRSKLELGDADFLDLFASPFFNSLPVMRDRLLVAGPPRDYVMAFVQVPELTVVRNEQRYQPKGDRVVRYSSRTFAADIAFDEDGFVTSYEGFLERIS